MNSQYVILAVTQSFHYRSSFRKLDLDVNQHVLTSEHHIDKEW